METVERVFKDAIRDGATPGAVLIAETHDGSFQYAKALGYRSLESKDPMTLDTVMTIASCTKLLTSICILQLFQSGQLGPEDNVLPHLPELDALPILKGFDDSGEPILQKRKAPEITVRQLLTHSMGGSYLFIAPRLQQYYRNRAPPTPTAVVDQAGIPMLAEPGKIWSYSHGIDWAGLLLDRLTGVDLDTYMRQHIWNPLGISEDDFSFWPNNNQNLTSRRADVALRKDPKGPVHHVGRVTLYENSKDAFGGGGAFSTIPAFMKILRSIIDPKDERLLSTAWKEEMFKPQISKEIEDSLNKVLKDPVMSAGFVGELPASRVRYSWSYSGLLSMNDDPGWRHEGTLLWSGIANLLWYIDRKAGLCLVYGGQVLPPGDLQVRNLMTTFEKAVYQQLNIAKNKL